MSLSLPPYRIVHLTSVHAPADTRIFHRQCRSLAAAGFAVTLIAAADTPAPGVPVRQDGVLIRTVPRPRHRGQRFTRTFAAILAAAWRERADLYHFHDPELIPAGILLRLLGRTVVYDIHEDVPQQILSKGWIPRPLRHLTALLVRGWEAVAALSLSGFVAAWPAIAPRFPAARTVVVGNFPARDELTPASPVPYQDRPQDVAYVGGISRIRSGREMVEAMARLPESLTGSRLHLVGTFGEPTLAAEVAALPGWQRTCFHGWQDRAAVADRLGQVRVGLVVMYPEPNHLNAYPNKLFEYMAAGIPVVASDFPLWREIVAKAGCGLLVPPRDPAALADAITWLLQHPQEAEAMGAAGREAVQTDYSWERECATLTGLYQRLLAGGCRAANTTASSL